MIIDFNTRAHRPRALVGDRQVPPRTAYDDRHPLFQAFIDAAAIGILAGFSIICAAVVCSPVLLLLLVFFSLVK